MDIKLDSVIKKPIKLFLFNMITKIKTRILLSSQDFQKYKNNMANQNSIH